MIKQPFVYVLFQDIDECASASVTSFWIVKEFQ